LVVALAGAICTWGGNERGAVRGGHAHLARASGEDPACVYDFSTDVAGVLFVQRPARREACVPTCCAGSNLKSKHPPAYVI
jgi:hypothetical protein